MVDGSKFLVSPLETSEVGYTYQIKPPGFDDWYTVYLSWFEPHCLSCELEIIGRELTKLAGTTVGRYVIPIEDGYILITGEDFDGIEASRILAGGFIVLEVIQVGKVFKLAKGGKLFSKTGKPINVYYRVMRQFLKGITDDAIMEISCQFLINLVSESLKKPYESDHEIFLEALKQIDVKNAVLTGMISYASLDNASKHSFECAKGYFTRMQNGGDQLLLDIGKGSLDCLVQIAVSIAFSKANGTEVMKKVVEAFSDAAKRDILMRRFKRITSESCFKFIETTVIKSIQEAY